MRGGKPVLSVFAERAAAGLDGDDAKADADVEDDAEDEDKADEADCGAAAIAPAEARTGKAAEFLCAACSAD
jgi:hypothetical protein